MAHGNQERLHGHIDYPKHFIALTDDVTIIERTLRLLISAGVASDDIVVVAPSSGLWLELSNRFNCHLHSFGDTAIVGEHLLDGLNRTNSIWNDFSNDYNRSIILLGDVVFSPAVLALISQANQTMCVGRRSGNKVTGKVWGELYGLVVTSDSSGELITNTIANSAFRRASSGRLWELVAIMERFGIEAIKEVEESDYTDDVDCIEEIRDSLPLLRKAINLTS